MNSLSKVQALMVGFLLLLFPAYLIDRLLLLPAAVLLALQFVVARSELRRDYPEDWMKYTMVFVLYEAVIVVMVFFIFNSVAASLSMGSVYTMFMAVLFVLMMTITLKYLVGRGYCYGIVLFTSGEWAGVSVKPDLFSKISEADYAVRNPLGQKVKKGDRVRVRLKAGMNKSAPQEIVEVVKDVRRT